MVMHERILQKMRKKIRAQEYVMTTHADEEMWDDGLAIQDIENAILTGQITERQKDRHSTEWKYLIKGPSLDGNLIAVVAKVGYTGKVTIITVYTG